MGGVCRCFAGGDGGGTRRDFFKPPHLRICVRARICKRLGKLPIASPPPPPFRVKQVKL